MFIRNKYFGHVGMSSIETDFSGNFVDCRKKLNTSIISQYGHLKKVKIRKTIVLFRSHFSTYIHFHVSNFLCHKQIGLNEEKSYYAVVSSCFIFYFFFDIHHYLRTTNYYQMDRNLFTVRRQYHATLANFLQQYIYDFFNTFLLMVMGRNLCYKPILNLKFQRQKKHSYQPRPKTN